MRRVGTSAIWSLSVEKRTQRGHLETVAIDPSETLSLIVRDDEPTIANSRQKNERDDD
jgi:hypothetical protein